MKSRKRLTCSRSCANTLKFTGKEKIKWGRSGWFWRDKPNEYRNLHKYVQKTFGKPTYCEMCKSEYKKLYWANKSGKYNRDRSDWLMLCASCHWKFDYEKNVGSRID